MKKKIFLTLVMAVALVFGADKVSAKDKAIETINASQAGGIVTVSGTAENGMLAATVYIYNEAGTKLVAYKTVKVSNNQYTAKLGLPNGNYVIKAADYDGGEIKKTTLTVTGSTIDNPKTGDKILTYVGLLLISFGGLLGSALYLKRKKLIKIK